MNWLPINRTNSLCSSYSDILFVHNLALHCTMICFCQGFVLIYDVTNWESFKKLDKVKRDIDKSRDKREVSDKSCLFAQSYFPVQCASAVHSEQEQMSVTNVFAVS